MRRTNVHHRSWLVVLLLLLAASRAGVISAGPDVWTGHGPEGGPVHALAVDPATPSTLYAGTVGGGVFDLQQKVTLPGDLDFDCDVDIVDIMLVATRWNSAVGDPRYDPHYDLDGDGDIDIADIMLVASQWSQTCTTTPTEITLADTLSGANHQWYWMNVVVPAIQDELGIQVNYIPSRIAELTERMQGWEPGQGDVHLLFLKPDDLGSILGMSIPLLRLWPDQQAFIPNLAKCPADYLQTAQGVNIQGTGALYWRSQYMLIYNTAYVTDPPQSWHELYERRAEWTGHIGWLRPDSKSSGGRAEPYAFLNAYVPLTDAAGRPLPLADLQAKPEFQGAVTTLADLMQHYCKLAAEPPSMFEDFNAGDTWMAVYALDYSLWSISQGTMPPTVAATFLSDGLPSGADAYLAIPARIPQAYQPVVMDLTNYLLSDERQIDLISTMWQYTGTDIEDQIPAAVWQKIPKWSQVKDLRVRLTNKEVMDWIKVYGASIFLGE